MNYRRMNKKLWLLVLYIVTASFVITLIIPIIVHIMMKKKEKEFKKNLSLNGFNNYREIETDSLRRYFIFNEDGRFMEVLNGQPKLDDIRNYNVELQIPDNSNQSVDILAGYILAGSIGALAGSVGKPCYLILRRKNQENFIEPLKYRIYGKESIENMYNFLVFFKEKGYIQ